MGCLGIASPSWQKILLGLTSIGHFIVHIKLICVKDYRTKSVVANVFSCVKKWSNMRRRTGPCYRELTALPRPPNWTKKEEILGKGGMGEEDGNGKRGDGGKQVREIGENGKRRERRGERCALSFSSYIHHCLQNSFTL